MGEVYSCSSSNNYNPNKYPSRYISVFKGCTSLKKVRFEDGANSVALGSTYYAGSSIAIAGVDIEGRGLFADCPLEEVYLGRKIEYQSYSSNYSFSLYPFRYGVSAFSIRPS